MTALLFIYLGVTGPLPSRYDSGTTLADLEMVST